MINRYSNRQIVKNSQEMYEQMFQQRGLKFINQYETPTFIYPDIDSISKINLIKHIWKVGDKFYKLANTYYGDTKDWWIIAKFNNKPTESHIKIGDTILIPYPLQQIIDIMKG